MSEWISVNEDLPPIGVTVIVCGGVLYEPRMVSIEIDGDSWFWCWLDGNACEWDADEYPTHWMPLPEPPKQ